MKKLRFWFVALIAWFFLFYNLERLSEPLNIASFVYVLSAILAILIMLPLWPQELSLSWLFAASLGLFLGFKWWLGYPILGKEFLPLAVTEICCLWLTIVLAAAAGQRRAAPSHRARRHRRHRARAAERVCRPRPSDTGRREQSAP